MKQTRFSPLFLLLLFYGAVSSFSQNGESKKLYGRVVTERDGQEVGLENVNVSIQGHDFDITNADGQFKLNLPTDRDFVNIELTGTDFQMISPYGGIVNLPPEEHFLIKVCGEKNKRLLAQVEQSNKKIKQLEKEHVLDLRQLVAMQRTLIDTVLFYENIMLRKDAEIAKLEWKISGLETDKSTLMAELDALKKENQAQQETIKELMENLEAALEKKYLRQNEYFKEITATLDDYADKAKNLRDNLRPELISGYFLPQNEPMRQHLYKKEEEYNAAYGRVVKLREAHIEAVGHYWEKAALANEAADTYAFLLDELHRKGIYPMDASGVNENIRQWALNNISRGGASKAAQKAVEKNTELLNSQIVYFEKMKNQFIQHLKLGF